LADPGQKIPNQWKILIGREGEKKKRADQKADRIESKKKNKKSI
jgi:hypothetical protein